jgi:pantoate--beta-alanine ligase
MLYGTLLTVKAQLQQGFPVAEALRAGESALMDAGFTRVDYLEMRDATTLALTEYTSNARLFVAAWMGTTRLIDNVSLDTPVA